MIYWSRLHMPVRSLTLPSLQKQISRLFYFLLTLPHHTAVTHVDTLYTQGLHQNNKRHVQPPFILGNEFAGIIVSAPKHSAFGKGARVFGGKLGSYAECICVDEADVRRVPEDLTNAEAVAVGVSGAVSWGSLVKKVGCYFPSCGVRNTGDGDSDG
jgi:NADPH:quinone reductase-like Zn-dependent oxidoreductase